MSDGTYIPNRLVEHATRVLDWNISRKYRHGGSTESLREIRRHITHDKPLTVAHLQDLKVATYRYLNGCYYDGDRVLNRVIPRMEQFVAPTDELLSWLT